MRTTAVQWKRISGLILAVVALVPTTVWAQVIFRDPNLEAAILRAINKPAPPIYDTDLEGLTALNASFSGVPGTAISDLTGLEKCTGIKSLQLQGNEIAAITPLMQLSNLEALYLRGNKVNSLAPLANLPNLHLVFLEDNAIADVAALANNPGIDTTDVVNLTGNELNQMAYCTFIPEMESRGVTVYRSGACGERVVVFPDLNLDRKVRAALVQLMQSRLLLQGNLVLEGETESGFEKLNRLKTGELHETDFVPPPQGEAARYFMALLHKFDANQDRKVTLAEIAIDPSFTQQEFNLRDANHDGVLSEEDLPTECLTTLDASNAKITDLTGIRACINLVELNLAGNRIVDLSPMSTLALTSLNLSGNAIVDLSPLRRMTGLAKLDIQNQFVEQIPDLPNGNIVKTYVLSDLDILKELSGLMELYAGNNAISNLSPLRAQAFMRILSLSYNRILDISQLKDLTSLLSLDLVGNEIADISAVSGMTDLLRLALGDNAVEDITPIEPLKLLRIIDLSNNNLTSIDTLATLVHLENSKLLSPSEIYLHNDPSTKGFPKNKNQIIDITALAGLPSLEVVTLYNKHIDINNPQGNDEEIDPMVGNDVGDISPLVGNGGLGIMAAGQMKPDVLDVRGNQLNQQNLCVDIPLLQARDLNVYFDGTCCDENFELFTNVAEADTGTVDPQPGLGQRYCWGDQKRITATPAPGFRFDHWEIVGSGTETLPVTEAAITVTIRSKTYVTAVFGSNAQRYTLTLNVDPAGAGECIPDPLPDATDGKYMDSTPVSVTAKPKTGYVFDYWNLNTADKINPKKLTMNVNTTLTAHFRMQGKLYNLTTAVKGQGKLTITTKPVSAPQMFEEGTLVSVRAVADLGWRFDHWEGALTTSAVGDRDVALGQMTMTGPKILTAVFVVDGYDFTLASVTEGIGAIAVSPMLPPYGFVRSSDHLYRFKKDTHVHILAVAGTGSAFDHWTGNISGDIDQADLVMDTDKSIRAVFYSGTIRRLTISVQGAGTVSPFPGEYTYIEGKQLTLIATPDVGSRFERWTGDVLGTSNVITVTMNTDKAVTAVFGPLPKITAIRPRAGAVRGGDTVVIEGVRLDDASAVSFNAISLEIIAQSSTAITVKTPVSTVALPNSEGPVDVLVTTPLGNAIEFQGFTFMGQPVVGATIPSEGSVAGGNRILLRGKNLALATQVLFGGVAGVIEEASRENTRLYVVTNAHAPSHVDVELLSIMDPAVLTGGFEYVKVPQIFSISPNQGSTAGGDIVRISGDGLAKPKNVTFDGIPAVVSQATDTELEVVIPAHAAGTVNVSITTGGGTATLGSGFNYFFSATQLTCHVTSAVTLAAVTDATVRLDPLGIVMTENQFGDYVFTNVRPDNYSVVVTAQSYKTATLTVMVHANENTALDIQLQPEPKAEEEDCGSIFKRLDARIAETALPLSVQELPASTVAADSRLAIRLSSDDGVDPGSVWAVLTSGKGAVSGGAWRPTTPGDNRDGWVMFTPATPLAADETVTLTVGGVSAKGAILDPVSQDYVVTADKSSADDTVLPHEDSSIAPIPAVVANAKSAVYRIGPAGVYDTPVTVRIPVTADTDASALDVFYYSETAQHVGWYRGGNVTGWLVPDSVKTVQTGGQTFVEIQVNHSGVVQVGQRMAFGATAPFDMHATGSRAAWLALVGVSLVLGACLRSLLRGRTRPNTDRHGQA